MTSTLDPNAVSTALTGLAGWALNEEGAIEKRFVFSDFVAAFGFMTRVALAAEKAGHHPDWSNSYKTVTIAIVSHDAGGVTQKDLDLAARIEALA